MENTENNTDADDISVTTTTNVNTTIRPTGVEKEYVVKFVFTPTKDSHANVAKTHFALLKNIPDLLDF